MISTPAQVCPRSTANMPAKLEAHRLRKHCSIFSPPEKPLRLLVSTTRTKMGTERTTQRRTKKHDTPRITKPKKQTFTLCPTIMGVDSGLAQRKVVSQKPPISFHDCWRNREPIKSPEPTQTNKPKTKTIQHRHHKTKTCEHMNL